MRNPVRTPCCNHKHKHRPPSCFRGSTKNKVMIHFAHAYVLMLVLRASSRVIFMLVLNIPNVFLSCNHWNLGDRNHSSGNQTCSSSREGEILLGLVAPRCNTYGHVLYYCCCPMDRGLRIHCLGFRFMDRACSPTSGLYFTRPIPPPAVVEQFLLLRSGFNVLWIFPRSSSKLHIGTTSLIAYEYGQRYHEVFRAFFPQRLCVCPRYEKTLLTVCADLDTGHKEQQQHNEPRLWKVCHLKLASNLFKMLRMINDKYSYRYTTSETVTPSFYNKLHE